MSSGLYSETFTQWGSQESWPQFQSVLQEPDTSGRPRSSSFEKRPIDAVMEEFRRNGLDSPYDPEEEANLYRVRQMKYSELSGMGPPSAYLRQKSWPAPEASPAVSIPAPRNFGRQSIEEVMAPSVPELSGMGPPNAYLRQKSWPAPEASPAVSIPAPRNFGRQSIEEVMAPSVPELSGMGPPNAYLRQKSWPAPEASPAVSIPAPRNFGRQSIEEVMAPSVPELSGMGPPNAYLRQKSWPAPEASPAVSIPAPRNFGRQSIEEVMAPSVPVNMEEASPPKSTALTPFQIRVLKSLPSCVLCRLLRDLEVYRAQQELKRVKQSEVLECRFCKNNGEKESFYRSHRLRWNGRVVCPVLRAYHCRLCGAQGDTAHTLKYCPLATDYERMKSANMMQSIRQSSGRRRNWQAPSNDTAGYYGNVNPTITRDGAPYNVNEPLDPLWE